MKKETAYERYRKRALVPFQMALNRHTDADILAWLERQSSKAGAIKRLIRAELVKEGGTSE